MVVYKFGGASVNSAEGVRNTARIVAACASKPLVLVVSAMGKTTNKLEEVLKAYMNRGTDKAAELLAESQAYHAEITNALFADAAPVLRRTSEIFTAVKRFMEHNNRPEYDFCYDQIVSAGEVVSTVIVCEYLKATGVKSAWLDAREWMKTDSTFREANIRFDKTGEALREMLNAGHADCYVTQGFIGSNSAGETTTLGREGSDYSAAIIASLTDAESLTVWKDVPGILNADPRLFSDPRLLPELSYMEAAELSYYGAQIIHPKTIKPLVNGNIPLYVKSFAHPAAPGTVIATNTVIERTIPVIVVKKNQLLISVSPKDFSFALEDSLVEILMLLYRYRLKIHLIQSSPLAISVCMDDERNARLAIDEIESQHGKVLYNESLELVTIRNYTEEMIAEHSAGRERVVMQRDRATVRMLFKG